MKRTVDIFAVFKKNIPLLIGICLCVYFSYHIIFGRCSYPQLTSLRPVAIAKIGELDSLKEKTALLEGKVTLMRPATLSTDLLEEQIRYILGYNKSDEIVILSR
ncbi:MAG: septum formation initiator family protein [Alphaproteobacteria bacterium]|nr:septum formation initiator family protein [Alphaproteobacteria bacterium]